MHVRYRVLLEKGVEMMSRTLALADKTADTSAWVKRTQDAKAEMERALDDEKAQIAAYRSTRRSSGKRSRSWSKDDRRQLAKAPPSTTSSATPGPANGSARAAAAK